MQAWRELDVLERLLAQTASTGSEREVVRTFVEALSMWHDIDTRTYVADLESRLARDVSLPGARAGLAPPTLPAPSPALSSMRRLSAAETRSWGFGTDEDALVATVNDSAATPRTLVFIGPIPPDIEVRLTIYVDVLRQALRTAADVGTSRLIWALMQRLVTNGDRGEEPLIAVAAELSQVTVGSVVVAVRRADGVEVLSVPASTASDPPEEEPLTLSAPLSLPHPYRGSVTVRRPPGHPFTRRERRICETAAAVLGSWLAAALQNGQLGSERRTRGASFEDLIAGTLSGDADVSVLVFKPRSEGDTSSTRLAVGEIRRQLRPFDVAGTLTTGEIGVLLKNASSDIARQVARRLRNSFESISPLSSLRSAAVGIATGRNSGENNQMLFDQARSRALSDSDCDGVAAP